MQTIINTSHKIMHPIATIGQRHPLLTLMLASLTVSIMSHLFYITEWFDGRYMTGFNDGLSQMQPFKQFLYENYKKGEFFYSPDFGFGGGIYTQLGYYFSMSIVFMITAAITYVLETIGWISAPDIYYWADLILILSIIRLTVILMITSYYFVYMKLARVAAFCGAVIYGTNIIYFRHMNYWEFFTDAMIWFPLLLIGAEKIMREGKPGWFILAVSVSLFDNFYFSYVNFLLVGIYVLFRWMMKLEEGERTRWQQVKYFVPCLIAGFGISGFSFFPAVYGYLNNYRPPYTEEIPLFDFVDNVLLHGRIIYIPIFVLLCLFVKSLYQHKLFRFFAMMTACLIVLHFSPRVGSIFNGFSAPQYRWEHLLTLTSGGMTAVSLSLLHTIRKKQLAFASMIVVALYGLVYWYDPKFKIEELTDASTVIISIVVLLSVWRFVFFKRSAVKIYLIVILLVSCMGTTNFFQYKRLTDTGTEFEVSREYMESELYNGSDTQRLVKKLQAMEEDPLARIDWMADERNNTFIVQNFKGMSIYSSILNKELLLFYLKDLEIDMGRESVSRYASLGDRANLYSMLMGKYYIAKRGDEAIPYGFEEVASVGEFVAYENQNLLPFVRSTSSVFLEKELTSSSPVVKEEAMLNGIVLEKGVANTLIPASKGIMDNVSVKTVGSTYRDGVLSVTAEEGGVDLVVRNVRPEVKDYLVGFYIRGIKNKEEFILRVNDFVTTRKEDESIYLTNIDDIVVRVKAEETISIRMPKGRYHLKDFKMFEETYETLHSVAASEAENSLKEVVWEGNQLSFTYENNHGDKYAAIPLPFEKGWQLTVNGKEQEPLKANYAFTGMKLEGGTNVVEMVYYPPYLFELVGVSLVSLVLVGYVLVVRRKKS